MADVTTPSVAIECSQCGRKGSYATAKLIEKYGRDIGMPDLKDIIIGGSGCSSNSATTLIGCKARYSAETVAGWTGRS